MKTINSMKRDITGNTKSKMAGETEHARLGYALPVEVEMLIKEYAQPRYRASAHFKAMNTLFVYQKRGLMPIFLGLACPECDHPLLQTRLNVKYRKAQIMYRKRQLGEIYDDFVRRIPTLVDHESFKHDMLRCSRNLRFVTDELGRPIETNSSPMNCTDILHRYLLRNRDIYRHCSPATHGLRPSNKHHTCPLYHCVRSRDNVDRAHYHHIEYGVIACIL